MNHLDWFLKELFKVDGDEDSLRLKRIYTRSTRYSYNIESDEKDRLKDFEKVPSCITIFLQNKNITLWKFLVSDSTNSEFLDHVEKEGEYTIEEHLNIESMNILYILLGLRNDLTDIYEMLDYYIFFRSLGLSRGVAEIIYSLESLMIKAKYEEIVEAFKKCSQRLENESITRMFTSKDEIKINEEYKGPRFQSSFCRMLFHEMVNRKTMKMKRDYKDRREILDFFRTSCIWNVTTSTDFTTHKDFPGLSLRNVNHHIIFFKNLYEKIISNEPTNQYYDVTLEVDNSQIHCHLGVLIWKSLFFSKMIFFGGSETEEYNKSGKIKIDCLNKRTLRMLIEYCYTNKVTTSSSLISHRSDLTRFTKDSFSDIIEILKHSDQFMQPKLLEQCLNNIRNVCRGVSSSYNLRKKRFENVDGMLISENVKKRIIKELLYLEEKEINNLDTTKKYSVATFHLYNKKYGNPRKSFRVPSRPFNNLYPSFADLNKIRKDRAEREEIYRFKNQLKQAVEFGKKLYEKIKILEDQNNEITFEKSEAEENFRTCLELNKEMEKKIEEQENEIKFLKEQLGKSLRYGKQLIERNKILNDEKLQEE